MTNNTAYRIYPNTRWRVAIHLVFWCVLFLVYFVSARYIMGGAGIPPYHALLVTVSYSSVILFTHYLCCYAYLPYVQRSKGHWLMPILLLLVLYACSSLLTNLVTYLLARYHPDDPFFQYIKSSFYYDHWTGVFGRTGFRQYITFVVLYNFVSIGIKLFVDYYEVQRDTVRIQQERNRMEALLLRTQMRPRFFLQTLDSIRQSVPDQIKAQEAIDRLSSLMHFSLYESQKEQVSLREEMDFLQTYIDLERMRHREERVRLDVDFRGISHPDRKIRPLLLVNFLENAFKHGVNAGTGKAYVDLRMQEQDGELVFRIVNNKPVRLLSDSSMAKKEKGIGLANVKRRLMLEYADRHILTVREDDASFEVELTLQLSD